MLPGGNRRWSDSWSGFWKVDEGFWTYLVSNALGGARHLVHVRARLRHAILRERCRLGTGVYPHRVFLSFLWHLPGLAGRGADGQRYVVQRSVWQLAEDHGPAAWP